MAAYQIYHLKNISIAFPAVATLISKVSLSKDFLKASVVSIETQKNNTIFYNPLSPICQPVVHPSHYAFVICAGHFVQKDTMRALLKLKKITSSSFLLGNCHKRKLYSLNWTFCSRKSLLYFLFPVTEWKMNG